VYCHSITQWLNISELPDGNIIEVPFAAVKSVAQPVKSEVAASTGGREGKGVM
jgi:hypothetical protein